jgi:hypothetical protein
MRQRGRGDPRTFDVTIRAVVDAHSDEAVREKFEDVKAELATSPLLGPEVVLVDFACTIEERSAESDEVAENEIATGEMREFPPDEGYD